MRDGGLDAYFFVGGFPAGAITELAASTDITLVPVTGPEVDKILGEYGFFAKNTVPAETYKGVPATETISVAAQWVTSAKQPEDLVYNITKSLYSEATQKALQAGHAKGALITLDNAVTSAGIPFHPGAEKFYKEAGVLK
jgi:TRAP transporter TAXI family solute receptor